MFDTYTINTIMWTAVPRENLDPSVSSTSRVFADGAGGYAKVKMLPITGAVPEDAVFQISTSQCDVTGKALAAAQGQITLTSPRRITCQIVGSPLSLNEQLSKEVEVELALYCGLIDAQELQRTVLETWSA